MEEVKFVETTAAEMATLEPVVEKKPRKRAVKAVAKEAADARTVAHGVVTYANNHTGVIGFVYDGCGYQTESKHEHYVGDDIEFRLANGKIVIVGE